MNKLIDFLQNKEDIIVGQPIEEVAINRIEEMLGIRFADEYKGVLKTFGFVCVDGHEITGIANAKRLNVYDVTMKKRANTDCVLLGLYVIEQTYIDEIVIWQSASGEIYQTVANSKPEKIADSIFEYLLNM